MLYSRYLRHNTFIKKKNQSNEVLKAGLWWLIVDWLLLSIQSENILLLEGITISGEGLQKVGLKSISISYTLLADTAPSFETIRKQRDLFYIYHLYHCHQKAYFPVYSLLGNNVEFSLAFHHSASFGTICFLNCDVRNGIGWGLRNDFP